MADGEAIEMLDAETEFRRRLAIKLRAKGYEGDSLHSKIEELLRLDIPLRLLPDVADGQPKT
jgi:hypothetical protein